MPDSLWEFWSFVTNWGTISTTSTTRPAQRIHTLGVAVTRNLWEWNCIDWRSVELKLQSTAAQSWNITFDYCPCASYHRDGRCSLRVRRGSNPGMDCLKNAQPLWRTWSTYGGPNTFDNWVVREARRWSSWISEMWFLFRNDSKEGRRARMLPDRVDLWDDVDIDRPEDARVMASGCI